MIYQNCKKQVNEIQGRLLRLEIIASGGKMVSETATYLFPG